MNKKIFFVLVILAVLFLAAFASVSKAGATEVVGEGNPTVATLSPVDLYGQIVRDDQNQKILDFTLYAQVNGSPDYSNLGYASCVVDSDCLSGVQTCQAGVIPNSPDPGYCVPK